MYLVCSHSPRFLSLGVMEGLIGSVDYLHVRHKASAQLEASYTFLAVVHACIVLPDERLCVCTRD